MPARPFAQVSFTGHTAAVPRQGAILLAPAGTIDAAIEAFQAGADAVYVGLKGWSRGGAKNELTVDQVRQCAALARDMGCSLHLAVNVIPTQPRRLELLRLLGELAGAGVCAVIVNDLGFVCQIRRALPSLPVTVSVGCAALNPADALLYQELGAAAVVFPGYLNPPEIAAIKSRSSIQVEAMLHMVEEFNQLGKCWMPSYVNFAAAERGTEGMRLDGSVKRGGTGACFRICQQSWTVIKDRKPVEQRLLPSRQISRINEVPAYLEAGLDVIKIQGRSLAPALVGEVVAAYRSAIDAWRLGNKVERPAADLPRMWTVQGR